MNTLIARVSLVAALAVVPAIAAAQDKATEITAGVIGLGYTTCSGCGGVFSLATGGAEQGAFGGLGGATFAVGFYLSPSLSIEPSASVSTLSASGSSLTVYSLGLAMPFSFSHVWGRKGPYLAPRVGYNAISGGGASVTQFALGAAFGTKVSLNDMAALRLQANFDYGFEGSGILATQSFGAFVGLSVFLK